MALGARAGDIFRMIVGEGLTLSMSGLALGLVGAWWLGRTGASLLVGVTASNPVTFTTVSLLLTTIAMTACYFPARRAMAVDPMVALRDWPESMVAGRAAEGRASGPPALGGERAAGRAAWCLDWRVRGFACWAASVRDVRTRPPESYRNRRGRRSIMLLEKAGEEYPEQHMLNPWPMGHS